MIFTGGAEDAIIQYFSTYAEFPIAVYSFVVIFMFMSSFGLPIPEEVVLISSGLVAYAGSQITGVPWYSVVNPYVLSIVATLSVFGSDFVVFLLGRFWGQKILSTKFGQRMVKSGAQEKIQKWTDRWGMYAAGVFRFTPGLRFPGHLACGMSGLSIAKFVLVDGLAVLVSVPTQVWLVAHYGREIIGFFQEFKIVVGILILVALIVFFAHRWWNRKKKDNVNLSDQSQKKIA